MSHPYVHAQNSAKRFGGKLEDYLFLHEWFDETKSYYAEMTHRALRHHSQGIFECEQVFGATFTNSDGRIVYTRYVGEQHILEDLGFIPTVADWLSCMDMEKWMMARSKRVKEMAERPAYPDNLPKSLQDMSESAKQMAYDAMNADELPQYIDGGNTPFDISKVDFTKLNNQKENENNGN